MRSAFSITALLIMSQVPCVADVLWDNGSFDGRNGMGSYWDLWTADDFVVTSPVRIERATAEFYVDLANWTYELADVGIWTEPVPGEGPQDSVAQAWWLPMSYEKIGQGFGRDIIAATVEGLSIELEPGDYFFGMRLNNPALLATTGDGVLKGRDGGWCQPLPEPFWFPVEMFWGYDSDFAFRLEGIPEPTTATLLLLGLAAVSRRR